MLLLNKTVKTVQYPTCIETIGMIIYREKQFEN